MSNYRSSSYLSNDTNFVKIRHPSKKLWPFKVVGGACVNIGDSTGSAYVNIGDRIGGAYVNIGDSIGGAYVNIGDSIGSTYVKVSSDLDTSFLGQNGPFQPLFSHKHEIQFSKTPKYTFIH